MLPEWHFIILKRIYLILTIMIDLTITSMVIPGGALLGITTLLFLQYHLSCSAISYLKFKARKTNVAFPKAPRSSPAKF